LLLTLCAGSSVVVSWKWIKKYSNANKHLRRLVGWHGSQWWFKWRQSLCCGALLSQIQESVKLMIRCNKLWQRQLLVTTSKIWNVLFFFITEKRSIIYISPLVVWFCDYQTNLLWLFEDEGRTSHIKARGHSDTFQKGAEGMSHYGTKGRHVQRMFRDFFVKVWKLKTVRDRQPKMN